MSQLGQYRFINNILSLTGDSGGKVSATNNNVDLLGGTNLTTVGTPLSSAITFNLDDTITLTRVNALTFDTNIAAAGLTLSGTTLAADGTDANIDINITPKGTGVLATTELTLVTDLSVAFGGTGASTFTDHGVLVGSDAGPFTALTVGTDGQVLLGATGADPAFATLTSTGGTVLFTLGTNSLNLEAVGAGINESNIYYVGKHGNDAYTGRNIEQAFLTFGAAMTVAGTNDVITCFDKGLYLENISGKLGVDIFAPNAIIGGAHTIETDEIWRIGQLEAVGGTTAVTFTSSGEASVTIDRFDLTGNAIGLECKTGGGNLSFAVGGDIQLDSGSLVGPATDASVFLKFKFLNIQTTGTAFACTTGGIVNVQGEFLTDIAASGGTLFATTGGGLSSIAAVISELTIDTLSNIVAVSDCRLTSNIMSGNQTESGAGFVTIGGSDRLENVPIGLTTPSAAKFTTLTATSLTDKGVLVGGGTTPVAALAVATDGQVLLGSTGADPAFATLASADSSIAYTLGAASLDLKATPAANDLTTGFESWTGGGAPYFDDSVLGQFTLQESGTGYIKGEAVSWSDGQTVTGMTAGNTYFIYIDSAGILQKTTTRTSTLFANNIVLFEVLRDSTTPTNNQVTVKENHPYTFPWESSNYLHDTIGTVIEGNTGGANIVLNGTVKIQINGADELDDHGLETDIPDSGGVGVSLNQYFTNGSGKWVLHTSSDTFTSIYNNAGTITALPANRFGIYTLYVCKDNINSSTPVYYAVVDDDFYITIGAAQSAIAAGATSKTSGELAALEFAQLGYVVFGESAGQIVDVIIEKTTLRSSTTTSGTNDASLVLTDITNFNGFLSSADTNVQAALETLDDFGTLTNGQLLIGNTGNPPASATLTEGIGITITNAAGTVTLANTGTTLNNQTGTTYTLVLSDAGKLVTMNNAAAITMTVPKNSVVAFPIGTQLLLSQLGAGQVTVAPVDGDVTIRSTGGLLSLFGQYSVGGIIKINTNEWQFGGDLG